MSPDGTSVVCTIQMADRRALATITLGPGSAADLAPADRQRDGRRFRGAALVARRPIDCRGAAHPGRPRGDRAGRRCLEAGAHARQSAGRPHRIAGLDARRQRGALLGCGRRRAVPDLSRRRSHRRGVAARGHGPKRAVAGRLRGRPPLVFVGYTADGYDLFSLRSTMRDGRRSKRRERRPRSATARRRDRCRRRSGQALLALRTLAPTFWTPTLESDADELVVGAATGSADALGRHAYGIEAGWSARARPDWQVAYAYDRWRPTLFAAYSDDTDPWREGEVRTREAEAGALLPFQQVAASQSMLASVHVGDDQFRLSECEEPVDAAVTPDLRARRRRLQQRAAVRLLHQRRRRRPRHGHRGSIAGTRSRNVVGRRRRQRPRADRRRALLPAGRGAPRGARRSRRRRGFLGRRRGRAAVQRLGQRASAAGFGFGVDAIGLLRGFGEDAVAGTRAAVVNVDYRLPLMRIARGVGTIPVFIRNVHGAVFVDVGEAWTDGAPLGRRQDVVRRRAFGRYGARLRAAGHVHRRRRAAPRRPERSAIWWPSDGSAARSDTRSASIPLRRYSVGRCPRSPGSSRCRSSRSP